MTMAERAAFQQGFLTAFAIAANVQKQCLDHIGDCLTPLERAVDRLEHRSRLRPVGQLVPAGMQRDGRQLFRVVYFR
jgi:hypothetical protein